MSIGSTLKNIGKVFITPIDWINSPAGYLLDQGLNFLGQYYGNQANEKLWREQAEWNKPINQLARLREAGLNPNLIYGSGGVQNTITSAPKMEPYHFDLMNYQQVLNGEAQRELLQEQKKLTQLKGNESILNAVKQELDNIGKGIQNEYDQYELEYYKKHGTVKGAGTVNGAVDRLTSSVLDPVGSVIGDSVGSLQGRVERNIRKSSNFVRSNVSRNIGMVKSVVSEARNRVKRGLRYAFSANSAIRNTLFNYIRRH